MTTADRRAVPARPAMTLEPVSPARPSDPFADLTYDDLPTEGKCHGIGTRLRAALAAERWVGAGVEYGRRAGGVVTATVLGVTGVGSTSGAALLDLERRLDGETYP